MSIEQLKKWANSEKLNIASEFKEDRLQNIGNRVMVGFKEDESSMSSWLSDVKQVEELICLASEKKNVPLPNSANIKYPLITKAVYEFSSRTYPEIVRDGKVVKGQTKGRDETGEKAARAERTSAFINYQLIDQSDEWELELDRLLNLLAMIGFICKKTYWDPIRKTVKSEICDYKELFIHSDVKCLYDAPRVSHILHYRLNDLIEHMNAEEFLKEPVKELIKQYEKDDLNPTIDLIEQHTWLDMDNDGYSEPYIVTVVKENGKVLRIAPRYTEEDIYTKPNGKLLYIEAIQCFTDYHFLVSPKGKFQSVGFGILMLQLNETINSILNQLVDSGQLANLNGGFIDARIKPLQSGSLTLDPGQWQKTQVKGDVSLRDGIMPFNYKEPSAVLYKLLELLINAAKDLSSSTEVMTGAASTENAKTGAVNALMSQGLKIFNSIQRRIYRSLTCEYKKIFKLNGIYLDEAHYFNVLDDTKAVARQDFNTKDIDIIPVADPNLSTEVQRSMKNQTLMAIQGLPGVSQLKVSQRILMNTGVDNPEDLLQTPEEMDQQSKSNPELIKAQAEIGVMVKEQELNERNVVLKEKQQELDTMMQQVEVMKLYSEAIKNLALAEAAEQGPQIQQYQMDLKKMAEQMKAMLAFEKMNHEDKKLEKEHTVRLMELDSAERTARANKSVEKPSNN